MKGNEHYFSVRRFAKLRTLMARAHFPMYVLPGRFRTVIQGISECRTTDDYISTMSLPNLTSLPPGRRSVMSTKSVGDERCTLPWDSPMLTTCLPYI